MKNIFHQEYSFNDWRILGTHLNYCLHKTDREVFYYLLNNRIDQYFIFILVNLI